MQRLRAVYTSLTFILLISGSLSAQNSLTGNPDVTVTTGNSTTSTFRVLNSSNAELLRVQADGKVGIGTANPTRALDIFGRGSSVSMGILSGDATQYAAYSLGRTAGEGLLAVAAASGQFDTYAIAGDMVFRSTTGSVIFNALNATGGISFNTGNDLGGGDTPRMTVLHSGKVGIGTTSPTALLQVSALVSSSPAQFKDMAGVNGTAGVCLEMAASSEIHVANLQIGNLAVPVIQTTGAGYSALYLNKDSDNDVIIGGNPTPHGHGLLVQSTGTSSFAGSVTIDHNLTVTGTVYANYQDVAEWVPAANSMPAGTVVVISDDANNTVTASTRAYDTGVAGVVSASPGLLLGVGSDSKAKIATTGRVKVRVDASKGPIQKGDLLVTSDRPGMAMKSEPLDLGGTKIHRPGTLIGKALEPLAGGEGEILVLLSLQ